MNRITIKRRGFSLVELLVSTAIALIIGSAVIMLLVQQTQLTATQNRNMINAETVRSVLTFMTDEISMMGNGVPEPIIVLANVDEFIFYSDIDNDGTTDRIRYFRQGNELRRTLSTTNDGIVWNVVGTDVLIPHLLAGSDTPLPGLRFEYYGVNNSTTPATADEIRAVKIMIGLDTTQTTTAFTDNKVSQQNMVAYATIRNRKL
jgi:prepilin-type N-terminal cleavage/methylation domain-containing protein